MAVLASGQSPLPLRWPNFCLSPIRRTLSRILILILLARAGISPNPGPPSPPPCAFIQWNCNGLTGAAERLSQFLHQRSVKVAAIQETKLKPNSRDPKIPGYSLLRRDRPGGGGGGGVALLIHHSVSFTPIPFSSSDPHLEVVAANVLINRSPFAVINVYCPPASACAASYLPDISAVLDLAQGDSVVLGDWNAHHEAWFSEPEDRRGEALAEAIENSDLCILNQDSPTRIPLGPNNNQRSTSPDISLISAHLALAVTWLAVVHLSSDHLPIVIAFDDESTPDPRRAKSFVNFNRAEWTNFKEEADSLISQLPPPSSCSSGEKLFRKAVLTASKHHIPAGFRKDFVPGRNAEVDALQQQYDDLRSRDPRDPTLEQIEGEIRRVSAAASRAKWQDFVETLDRRSNPRRYWQLLRNLSGAKSSVPPNQFIRFGNKLCSKPAAIAKKFNHQYTNIRKHSSSKLSRLINRNLRDEHPIDHSFRPFTLEDTAAAIKRSKNSSALGPDGLAPLHLKHLGPAALSYLTELFNLSVADNNIPAIWKNAVVLPVLKPGKSPSEGVSYRPISLLCPSSKILERLLLPFLTEHLPLDASQHGFRAGRSPTSALLPLVSAAVEGFNEQKPAKRTVSVAIDLSKAFDSVNHDRLLKKLSATSLPHNVIRWLATFLKGREQSVTYNGHRSPYKHVHLGVPQGAVLSPTLFNFYVADFPELQCSKTSFADDFNVFTSDSDIDAAVDRLNSDLSLISGWSKDVDLDIAPSKSSVTLFTSNTHEHSYHPQVKIEELVDMGGVFGHIALDCVLPLVQRPKILGVKFDTHLTFSPHARDVARSCTERLKVMKALAGTSWGQDSKTLSITYKALIRSKLDYAAPIWAPNVKNTPLARLQAIQNSGLRIATGAVKMTPPDHLHSEAKMLKVDEHLHLLAAQYLASALRETHPMFPLVTHLPGPRSLKRTLQDAFYEDVAPYLVDGVVPLGHHNDVKNKIHADYVRRAINSRRDNVVLNRTAPPLHSSESRLPRAHRSTMAQLRSGYCSSLNSYLVRVGRADSSTCPQCGVHEHTSVHLFNCPHHPTNLCPIDLWLRPQESASFLSSLPPFSHLPPLAPPPPPPPRPRPPPEPPP